MLDRGNELLVPEEQVPAEGVRLTRVWQYARWIDGSVHLWSAVRKRAGRGTASSGLVFDGAEPWHPPPRPLASELIELRVTSGASADERMAFASSSASEGEPVDLDHLRPGQTAVVCWRVHNSGSETWRQAEPNALRLATAILRTTLAASPRRAGSAPPVRAPQSSRSSAQGRSPRSSSRIRAPAVSGKFEESYDLIVEGQGRVSGPGLRLRGQVMGWVRTGSLALDRLLHTGTLLRDGRVLVVGGWNPTAELYHPATGTWSSAGNAPGNYRGAVAVLLRSGKLLVAGAASTGNSTALYDPETGVWSATGNLARPRYYHTATLLQDGRVLVTGGVDQEWSANALTSSEIYNPITGTPGQPLAP